MRKYAALAIVAFVALAGCTSASDDDTDATTDDTQDTATETTLDPVLAGRAPGVTDDTIKVGVTYVDLEAIKDIVSTTHGDYEATYKAYIDDINARGGINGRMLEAVFAPINPIGTQPAEEACLKLTEDDQVFVTIGFFQDESVLCYLETHDTAVVGGTITPERQRRANAPWYSMEQSADFQVDALTQLAEAGALDGKLGVFALATQEAILRDTVEPTLQELGIEPVETSMVDAPPGDQAATNAATQVIAERFKASGVDKVLVVGQAASAWALGIESTSYRPELRLLGVNEILSYINDEAGRDLSVLDGAMVSDIYSYPPLQWEDEYYQERCQPVLTEAGIDVPKPKAGKVPRGTEQPFVSARVGCMNVVLLEALLTGAGEDLNYATFQAAADEIGELRMPTTPEPYFYGNGEHADGDPPVYLYDWDPEGKLFDPRDF